MKGVYAKNVGSIIVVYIEDVTRTHISFLVPDFEGEA